MGTFYQAVKVGNPSGGDFVEIEAMVDTGATDSMFPESLLTSIHVQPLISHIYILADGSEVELPYGQAVIEINGETRYCPVVFGNGDEVLLGATTLEIFKLLVDPNSQSLRPASHSQLGGSSRPYPL